MTPAQIMTERDLDRAVRQLAALLRIRVFSVRNSRAGVVTAAGYPDLTLVGAGGIAFRELKSQRGKPTPAQLAWGSAITSAGGDWKIWRPSDLTTRVVECELRLIATPAESPP